MRKIKHLAFVLFVINGVSNLAASGPSQAERDAARPAVGVAESELGSEIGVEPHLETQSIPSPALPSRTPFDKKTEFKNAHSSSKVFLTPRMIADACDDSAFDASGDTLLAAIKAQGVECINRLFNEADLALRSATFSEANILTVANAAKTESENYLGSDPDRYLESLYTWIKAFYYFDNRALITASNQAATRAALVAFAANAHFYDKTPQHASLVFAAMINLNNALLGEHFVYLVENLLTRYDESYEQVEGWGRAFATIFFDVLYQCQRLSDCRIANIDTDLVQQIGDFIHDNLNWLDNQESDYHLHNLGYHLGSVYNGKNDSHFEALRPELEKQLNKVFSDLGPLKANTGRRAYLQALAEVDWFGECAQYSVCGKIDEIINLVLDDRINCPSGTLFMWAQDMDQPQLEWACSSLLSHETYFHSTMATANQPVVPDDNESLRMVVFNDAREWSIYGGALFGASTDNGGLYLEGDPAVAGDQATFFAYEDVSARPVFDIWNLHHEYIHYLDGRFITQGDFSDVNGAGRTVWYGEGIAEYISRKDCNDDAVAQAATGDYPFSTLLTNEYGVDSTRIYSWGYLAVRFMFEEKSSQLASMLNLFKQGEYQTYRETLVDVWVNDKTFDAEFAAWLPNVESLNCMVDDTRPPSPIEPIDVDEVQGSDLPGIDACGLGRATGSEIEAGVALCLAPVDTGEQLQMALYVPNGLVDVRLAITLEHGDGNADLLHRFDSRPSAEDFDFISDAPNNDELIIVNPVQAGWNYIHVVAEQAFSGVTLLARYIQNDGSVNELPLADAGANASADEQTQVVLDGAASYDPDGEIVRYAWRQLSGPSVTLVDHTSRAPAFLAPVLTADETLVFELTVMDDKGAMATDTVEILVYSVNILPTANAGPDQSIDEQTQVVLNASASSDADGSIASYLWTQISGSPVTLNSADTMYPIFIAPTLQANETLVFQLTISDNEGDEASDTVQITVNPVNAAPYASAGPDDIKQEQTLVSLNGSGSNDSDGQIASFAWRQIAGTSVSLDGDNISNPSFIAPTLVVDETLIFELTVTDNEGATATDTVEVQVYPINAYPLANAGEDFAAEEQTLVTLNGALSSDSDGDIIGYSWTQIGGTSVTLTDANISNPSFTTPTLTTSETLTFSLTVFDNEGATSTDLVDVLVNFVNAAPIAQAGEDFSADEANEVTLNAAGSQDSDGEIISYLWQQADGREVVLSNPTASSATFIAPMVTDDEVLTFRLTVTDNEGAVATETIEVTILNVNALPTVNAGDDQVVDAEATVKLAAISEDDDKIASYLWRQLSGPAVALSSLTINDPSFTAPKVSADTVLVFELVVTDSGGLTATDQVQVTVKPAPNSSTESSSGGGGNMGPVSLLLLGLVMVMRRRFKI